MSTAVFNLLDYDRKGVCLKDPLQNGGAYLIINQLGVDQSCVNLGPPFFLFFPEQVIHAGTLASACFRAKAARKAKTWRTEACSFRTRAAFALAEKQGPTSYPVGACSEGRLHMHQEKCAQLSFGGLGLQQRANKSERVFCFSREKGEGVKS